jgi:hypothetical protein
MGGRVGRQSDRTCRFACQWTHAAIQQHEVCKR